jgi:hypothetical protein
MSVPIAPPPARQSRAGDDGDVAGVFISHSFVGCDPDYRPERDCGEAIMNKRNTMVKFQQRYEKRQGDLPNLL